jgi:competence protein ComEC
MSRSMPRAAWLAVGGVAAALATPSLSTAPVILLLAIGLLAVGAVLILTLARATGRRRLAWLLIGALLVAARVGLAGLVDSPSPTQLPDSAIEGDRHTALIVSIGTPAGGQQRAVIELQPPAGPTRAYAWLPRYPAVIPGDIVVVDGRLEAAPVDPGFGEFLARSGIGHTLRSRQLDRIAGHDTPLAALEQLRRGAGDRLAQMLPQPQAGLGAAILVGLRDVVPREVAADFRTAGLSHVVAISGWHVAIVAGVISALLAGLSRRRRSVLLVVAIGIYALLAGGAPSVVRASLMASVVLLARESGRRGQAAAALGLAVLVMLLVDPSVVGEVGFQLSVTATFGLLCWATPLGEWLRAHTPRAIPGWLLDTLAVSLAAQAATLPLVLLHFGRLSLVAPAANLLVAPLVAPAMLGAALSLAAGLLAASGMPAMLLAPVAFAGSAGLGLMIAIANGAASLPFAAVELEPPLDVGAALAAAGGLLITLRRSGGHRPTSATTSLTGDRPPPTPRPRRRLALAGAALALCLVAVSVAGARPDGRLHMTVLDVGQGDAILLQGPNGGRMLVDAGPDPDRLLALLDERLPAWDRRLDLVAVTHPHEDHVAGLALLLDRYRIGGVIEPGMVGPGPGDAAFRRRLAELGRQTRVVAAGDRLVLDGIAIDIHWPLPGRVPLRATSSGKQINNVSLVFDLRFGDRRLLLTGDVEEDIDPQLLAAGLAPANGRRLDVLKVAHHGSATATTDAFVERLAPHVAIVSAGAANPYGHPSPRTVARLEQAGARLFRTDLDGTVTVSTNGHDLLASAGGGRPPPARRSAELPPGIGFCPLPQRAAMRRRPYNRRDAHPQPRRRRSYPGRSRRPRLATTPFWRRSRDRHLPCRAHPGARHAGRCCAGRGGGTAPRSGQDAARRP